MEQGRGEVACEGSQVCQAGGWKSELQSLGNVSGKSEGQEMESFQCLGGGGRDHAYRYGHMKLPRDGYAALRKVDLHKELCLPWMSGI